MVRVMVNELRPGMVLASPLVDADGRVLLRAGVVLKESYISRLRSMGYASVYVRDGVADDVPIPSPISDETRREAEATVRQVFTVFSQNGSISSLDPVRKTVHAILDELLNNPGVKVGLSEIRSSDAFTFAHSVDVCVMAIIAGQALGYNPGRLHELGMGALLHDIGKTRVDPNILKKPSGLTPAEFEEMKKHTIYGFELLRGRRDISAVSAHVAYQHHERSDGSGYPRSLTEPNIHPLAQIVAVVDIFDAMTADRVYRAGLPHHTAARQLASMAGTQLNSVIVERFLARVALFPVGVVVRLQTGELAFVVAQNDANLGRPVVRIFTGRDGRPLRSPIQVDLLNDRSRHIEGVVRWTPNPEGSSEASR